VAAGSGVTSEIVGEVVGVGVGDGVMEAVELAKVLVEAVAEIDGDEEGVCSLRALLPEHPVNNTAPISATATMWFLIYICSS
jgi:hypothetical protein